MAYNDNVDEFLPAKKKKLSVGGRYCAVAECNSSSRKGVTMHSFPSETETNASRCKQWITFVTTCRADFGKSYNTPNKYSIICSLHFTPDSYPDSKYLSVQFCLRPNNYLKATAVPTIQKPHRSVTVALTDTTSTTTTMTTSTSGMWSSTLPATCTNTHTCISSTVCTPSVLLGVKRVRGAYLKRDHKKVPSEKKQMKNKRVQAYPAISCKGVQCDFNMEEAPTMRTVTTQCNLDLDTSYVPLFVPQPQSPANSEITLEDEPPADFQDKDYVPEEEDLSADELERDVHSSPCTKFIVFEEQLIQLFRTCHRCAQPASCDVHSVKGSLVRVQQDCPHCNNAWTWESQPFVRDVPAGNLIMSAAILFSGSIPSKALAFLKNMGVAAICNSTYFDHQRAFLHPAVEAEWRCWQTKYVAMVKESGQELTLGGDGRADSPGHCAKYGVYTHLDVDYIKIADVRMVQSNEVGNSQRMEKEGLERGVDFLLGEGLTIRELITYRHPMVIKWLRENQKGTKHSIDIWHVANGLKKRLLKLALEKDCFELTKWIKSIVNHLYWVAASTPQADGELMLQKWLSLADHLHNKHTHKHSKFPACLHPPRLDGARKNKWLKEGTKFSTKLLALLNSRQMHRDIPILSTGPQTAAIESFHSVLNHFAPKMVGFSYRGILHRSMLAALDFNENSNRDQATTKEGKPRYNVMFRKAKKGYCLQEVKVGRTHVYVKRLTKRVVHCASKRSIREILKEQQEAPLPLCSDFKKPNKEMIQTMKSRYSQK